VNSQACNTYVFEDLSVGALLSPVAVTSVDGNVVVVVIGSGGNWRGECPLKDFLLPDFLLPEEFTGT